MTTEAAWRRLHFHRNRMVAITSKAVHNRPHDEMRAKLLAQTIEFVDVALSVSYVDASLWAAEQANCRLTD